MKDFFETFNLFTPAEIDEIIAIGKIIPVKKGDYFIQEGQVCNKVAFINKGIFRSFYYSSNNEEATYCLNFPKRFMTAYSSFITDEKTKENIQALSDGEVVVLYKKDLELIQINNPKWMLFAKRMAEQQYLELEQRVFQLQNEKAETRYNDLLTNHPEYVQQIPLHFLASYLGISQRHLSRIRKQISI